MFEPNSQVMPPPVNSSLLPSEPSIAMAQTSCPTPDPTVDLLDGSRTVEVTVLFGETVLQVRHLGSQDSARIKPLTLVLAVLGLAGSVAGGILVVTGQLGLASLLLPLGIGLGVLARSRVNAERRSPHFSLGEASESDLHLVSPAVPSPCFPLVEAHEQGGHLLNFTEQMQGDVTIGADRVPLSLLARSGHARPSTDFGCYSYPIPHDARIKVDVGDNTFLINSVPPPRQLQGSALGQLDWSRQTFNGVSFGVHATVLLLVFLVPPDGRALSLDTFNIDNQRVETRLIPVKMPEDTMDRILRQKVKEPAGKPGALYKGEAGKAGNKNSKQHNRRIAVKGDHEGLKPARELAEQEARKAGILGLLGGKAGSRFASIFSDSEHALGDDAVDALGNLIGDRTGESYGIGGVGIAGTMRGGGGGLGGSEYVGTGGPLHTIGRGGNDPNGGKYGLGQGKLGDHRTRTPKPRIVVKVKGALSKEIIRRVVRRHINQVRYCYQNELQSNPELYGRVMVKFAIVGNGQVASSVIESSTLSNSTVETCISRAVRRWLFPKPEGGGTVIVSYPFVLHAAGAGR